ncbi:MAG: TylF/MycF/NovP-related O-methyltransferase [Pseudomonadota bacterium]
MFHLLEATIHFGVPGHIVELGCNTGQSAALFQRIIDANDATRELHLYDSFEGLPDVVSKDGSTVFSKGEMSVSEREVINNFQSLGLKMPNIHKGWFQDTLPTELPDQIAFAHLDGDLYSSILESLEHVYPRLSPGAVCLIDDYANLDLFGSVDLAPGVKQACDEFLSGKPEKVSLLYGGFDSRLGYGSHGYFRKVG